MKDKKYKHLTSTHNSNKITLSVKDTLAAQIDAAFEFVVEDLGISMSRFFCDAILEKARALGFEAEP